MLFSLSVTTNNAAKLDPASPFRDSNRYEIKNFLTMGLQNELIKCVFKLIYFMFKVIYNYKFIERTF